MWGFGTIFEDMGRYIVYIDLSSNWGDEVILASSLYGKTQEMEPG